MIRRQKPIPRTTRVRKRKPGKRANLARECAALWSEKVRAKNDGRCMVAGYNPGTAGPCEGRIEAAHCFGKKARPGVRYAFWAGWPVCAKHHRFYGNGEAWNAILWSVWGAELYAERYLESTKTHRADLADALADLGAA